MPRITHDREQIHRFFELLYGDVERESARLPVWHTKPREGRPDKKFPVLWSADTSSAADAVAGISPTHGIYFGVCWHDPALVEAAVRLRNPDEAPQVLANRLSYSRGFADTTTVMPGLWLDVDFGTDGHDQGNLPPTMDAARQIIAAMPLPPSITVSTGGGFHVYWLFREPWDISVSADRAAAAATVYGWTQLARETARDRWGWTVDSTGDLTRVLRPVGSVNHKHNVLVTVEDGALEPGADFPRYNPSEFELWAVTPQQRAAQRPLPDGALLAGVSAPADLLELMLELDAGFAQTWNRRRQGQFGDDASRYEQALATRALQSGWTDEDTIALLIQFRREKFNEGPKHAEYYRITLATARGDARQAEAFERVDALVRQAPPAPPLQRQVQVRTTTEQSMAPLPPNGAEDTSEPPAADQTAPAGSVGGALHLEVGVAIDPPSPPQPDPDQHRVDLLEGVSQALQGSHRGALQLRAVVKYESGNFREPPVYAVLLGDTEVRLGPIDVLLNYRTFRTKVLDATHVLPAGMKQVQWERLLRGLLTVIQIRAYSERGEEIREVVLDMLRSSGVVWHNNVDMPHRLVSYYGDDGTVLLSLQQLRQWMQAMGDRMSPQDIAHELRTAGSAPMRRWFYHLDGDGIRQSTQLRLWTAPWVDAVLPRTARPDHLVDERRAPATEGEPTAGTLADLAVWAAEAEADGGDE
jgi:hypothetical protein